MPDFELICRPAAERQLTLEALAAAADLHADLVRGFLAYGLLEPLEGDAVPDWFDAGDIGRLRTIQRLRNDLGINLAGIAAVLDLLDRIKMLQRELAQSRGRVDRWKAFIQDARRTLARGANDS